MQTIKQAEGFKLHDYDPLTGRPARAGFTRHGHAIDISQDAIIVTARGGYAVELQAGVVPGKGLAKLRTPAGLTITLNDETGVLEITTATGQMLQLDDLNQSLKALIGRDIDLDVGDELSLTASRVTVNLLGPGATITSEGPITLQVGSATLRISEAGFDFTGG